MKHGTPRLDAYGHLTWTVGNEDWLACFDAIREGARIHYHTVVNCESGGFIDTLEDSYVPLTPEGAASLKRLPDYWVSICRDNYIGETEPEYQVNDAETQRCIASWAAHLDALVADGPCTEDNPCECCTECCEEAPDPVRDGWVGSDGLP